MTDIKLPDEMDTETFAFVMEKYTVVYETWMTMMSELDPEKLPLDVTLGINRAGDEILAFLTIMVRHATARGFHLPDRPDWMKEEGE